MTLQRNNTPEWAVALGQILAPESARGYDNGAVIGGLDRFRERWKSLIGFTETDTPPRRPARSATADSPAAHPAAGSREANGSPPRPAHPAVPERSVRTPLRPRPAFGAPPDGQTVDAPIGQFKGVDGKTAQRLERLDVATARDLLYLFPRRHDDYSNIVSIAAVAPGQECPVVATVWEARVLSQGGKGRRKDIEAAPGDDTVCRNRQSVGILGTG